MELTNKEIEILKLIVEERTAKTKLNKVNSEMGNAIRAEFSKIDAKLRKQYQSQYQPLEEKIKKNQENIKNLSE